MALSWSFLPSDRYAIKSQIPNIRPRPKANGILEGIYPILRAEPKFNEQNISLYFINAWVGKHSDSCSVNVHENSFVAYLKCRFSDPIPRNFTSSVVGGGPGICISNKQSTLASDVNQTTQHIEKDWDKALKRNLWLINNELFREYAFCLPEEPVLKAAPS